MTMVQMTFTVVWTTEHFMKRNLDKRKLNFTHIYLLEFYETIQICDHQADPFLHTVHEIQLIMQFMRIQLIKFLWLIEMKSN